MLPSPEATSTDAPNASMPGSMRSLVVTSVDGAYRNSTVEFLDPSTGDPQAARFTMGSLPSGERILGVKQIDDFDFVLLHSKGIVKKRLVEPSVDEEEEEGEVDAIVHSNLASSRQLWHYELPSNKRFHHSPGFDDIAFDAASGLVGVATEIRDGFHRKDGPLTLFDVRSEDTTPPFVRTELNDAWGFQNPTFFPSRPGILYFTQGSFLCSWDFEKDSMSKSWYASSSSDWGSQLCYAPSHDVVILKEEEGHLSFRKAGSMQKVHKLEIEPLGVGFCSDCCVLARPRQNQLVLHIRNLGRLFVFDFRKMNAMSVVETVEELPIKSPRRMVDLGDPNLFVITSHSEVMVCRGNGEIAWRQEFKVPDVTLFREVI